MEGMKEDQEDQGDLGDTHDGFISCVTTITSRAAVPEVTASQVCRYLIEVRRMTEITSLFHHWPIV